MKKWKSELHTVSVLRILTLCCEAVQISFQLCFNSRDNKQLWWQPIRKIWSPNFSWCKANSSFDYIWQVVNHFGYFHSFFLLFCREEEEEKKEDDDDDDLEADEEPDDIDDDEDADDNEKAENKSQSTKRGKSKPGMI